LVLISKKNVTPIALGVNTGYQFSPFIAAELGFNYFFTSQRDQMSVVDHNIPDAGNLTRVINDMYAFTLAGKVALPIGSVFSLYSKLGLAYTMATVSAHSAGFSTISNSQRSVSVSDISPMFGAGFQINLRNNLYAQLGWMMIPNKQTSCSMLPPLGIIPPTCPLNRPMINEVMGGLGYRFG
jgi:opacity protein-like surface antigen